MRSALRSLRSATRLAGTVIALAAIPAGVFADTLTARKCDLYAETWNRALELLGEQGLDPSFIRSRTAFIASGCADGQKTCPTSEAEIRLADTLTVLSMNEGMASTFVPFACPEIRSGPGPREPASPPIR